VQKLFEDHSYNARVTWDSIRSSFSCVWVYVYHRCAYRCARCAQEHPNVSKKAKIWCFMS